MSSFFTNYRVAYNHAVMEARKGNRVMRLSKGQEYTRKGFCVNIAVQDPTKRFGRDLEGEFIQPTDPLTVTHVAQAGYGYHHSGQNFDRLQKDTPVVLDEAAYAAAGSVIAYRVSDGLRMHIQKRALKLLTG